MPSVDSLENDDFYKKKKKPAAERFEKNKRKKHDKGGMYSDDHPVEKVSRFLQKYNLRAKLLENPTGSLAECIKANIANWEERLGKKDPACKSPIVIIATISARRALEILRSECNVFHNLCRVAKCFAKHMDIEEQRLYLNEHRVRIAVGTPHRLLSLISDKGLLTTHLQFLFLDLKSDEKGRNSLESNDTAPHLAELLLTSLQLQPSLQISYFY